MACLGEKKQTGVLMEVIYFKYISKLSGKWESMRRESEPLCANYSG